MNACIVLNNKKKHVFWMKASSYAGHKVFNPQKKNIYLGAFALEIDKINRAELLRIYIQS